MKRTLALLFACLFLLCSCEAFSSETVTETLAPAGRVAPATGETVTESATTEIAAETTAETAAPETKDDSGNRTPGAKTDDLTLFAQVAGEYNFASGAGGWWTSLRVEADGSFSGTYGGHDYLDPATHGYAANEYESLFHGRFVHPARQSDGSIFFEMGELIYEQEPGREEFTEIAGERVKLVYTTAYGLEKGKTFFFYPVGMPLDPLPEEFKNWLAYPNPGIFDGKSTLPCRGIYNVEEQYGFWDD